VADSGPGLPAGARGKVFERFFTGDAARGAGLGLAIARELATALGGRISLESSAEQGSRFELMLPTRPR
jgi:signal transduction histidine kinase